MTVINPDPMIVDGIPSYEWVAAWQKRMGFTDAEGAAALRLKNSLRMRDYRSIGRDKEPSMSLIAHMQLIETLSIATAYVSTGRAISARKILQEALMTRCPDVRRYDDTHANWREDLKELQPGE